MPQNKINPRFLEMARRMMNPNPPENRPPKKDLTHLLETDEDGKPKLKLTPLEKTAVNTPTQEDYDTLMRVYECGGWRWNGGGELPTEYNVWTWNKKQSCIDAVVDYKGEFLQDSRQYNEEIGWTIITPQQFYDVNHITPEIIQEINNWFEQNKPKQE